MRNRNNIKLLQDDLLHAALRKNLLNALTEEIEHLLIDALWDIIVSVLALLAGFRMFVLASLPEAVRTANNPHRFLPARRTRDLGGN